MKISEDRKYVIVCNEHQPSVAGSVLFWGSLTADDKERSYGGYTCQFDKCERYTRQELEEFRKGNKSEYPFFDEFKIKDYNYFRRCEEVLISIDELKSLGFKEVSIMTLL